MKRFIFKNWFLALIPLVLIPLYANLFGIKLPQLPVYFNITTSLPIGFYTAIPSFGYRNGDIVAYHEPENIIFGQEHNWLPNTIAPDDIVLLKHIALPGTPFFIGEDGSFCVDGQYIGQVIMTTKDGTVLPHLPPGPYVVPEGKFLPYSCDALSYDGRNTGLVDMDRIVHRVVPLFTR